MVLMWIWLSLLRMATLLDLGMLYHLYLGFLAGHFGSFVLGGPAALGSTSGLRHLHEQLVASVVAMARGRAKVHWVCEGNTLHVRAKGKTCEWAEEMTSGDLLSNCKQKQTGWSRRIRWSISRTSPLTLLLVLLQCLLLGGLARWLQLAVDPLLLDTVSPHMLTTSCPWAWSGCLARQGWRGGSWSLAVGGMASQVKYGPILGHIWPVGPVLIICQVTSRCNNFQ